CAASKLLGDSLRGREVYAIAQMMHWGRDAIMVGLVALVAVRNITRARIADVNFETLITDLFLPLLSCAVVYGTEHFTVNGVLLANAVHGGELLKRRFLPSEDFQFRAIKDGLGIFIPVHSDMVLVSVKGRDDAPSLVIPRVGGDDIYLSTIGYNSG